VLCALRSIFKDKTIKTDAMKMFFPFFTKSIIIPILRFFTHHYSNSLETKPRTVVTNLGAALRHTKVLFRGVIYYISMKLWPIFIGVPPNSEINP